MRGLACNPAAETAIQPQIRCFQSWLSNLSSYPEECFFHRHQCGRNLHYPNLYYPHVRWTWLAAKQSVGHFCTSLKAIVSMQEFKNSRACKLNGRPPPAIELSYLELATPLSEWCTLDLPTHVAYRILLCGPGGPNFPATLQVLLPDSGSHSSVISMPSGNKHFASHLPVSRL